MTWMNFPLALLRGLTFGPKSRLDRYILESLVINCDRTLDLDRVLNLNFMMQRSK